MRPMTLCLLLLVVVQNSVGQGLGRLTIQASPDKLVFLHLMDKDLVFDKDSVLQLPTGSYPFSVAVMCGEKTDINNVLAPFRGVIKVTENIDHLLDTTRFNRFILSSFPFGATVKAGDENLGTSPLSTVQAHSSLTIRLQKSGYKTAEKTLKPCERTSLVLEKLATDPQAASIWKKLPTKEYRWVSVLGGTAMVAGIVFSIQNKFKADDLYDRYKENGDPLLRPQIKALDTKAGWGLAIAQSGLAVIVVRLVLK